MPIILGSELSSRPNARRVVMVLVSLLITVALLWWSVRDVDLAAVRARMFAVSTPPLLVAIGLAIASIACRGVRWRFLFPASEEPSTRNLVRSTFIAALINNVFPVRAGEVAGALALNKLSRVPIATGLSSLAASRVLDVAVIAALLSIALFASVSGSVAGGLAVAVGLLALVLVAVLVLLARSSGLMNRSAKRFLDWLLPPRPATWSKNVVEQLLTGLAPLGSSERLFGALAWSSLAWTLNALAIWFGFLAFGVHVSPWAALTVQGFVAIAIALPSAPGFFGPFEAAGRVALGFYAIDATTAVSFILPFHLVVNFLPAVAVGLVALLTARES